MPDNISKIGSSDKDSTTTTAAPSTGSAAKPHPPAPEYIAERRSHLWIWIVVILVLGIGGLIYYRKQQAAEAAAKTKAAMANRSVPITTATVTTGPIGVYINALGTVTSVYTVTITSARGWANRQRQLPRRSNGSQGRPAGSRSIRAPIKPR